MFYDCPGLSRAVQSANACDAATGSAPSTSTSNANSDMTKPSKAASSKRCGSKNLDKKLTGEGVKRAKLTKVKKNKQYETLAHLDDSAWFCTVCNTEEQLSMTKCVQCGTWVHNDCVGLESDAEDYDVFLCPDCDE